MIRDIVKIDEELCDGCGNCVPGCHEGALQIIDGKARLVSDLMCDGLGACIGECPQGAITIEKREAEVYDERRVMEQMVKKGVNTVYAHLKHLKDHDERELLDQAKEWLRGHAGEIDFAVDELIIRINNYGETCSTPGTGCSGSQSQSFFSLPAEAAPKEKERVESALMHWPVQMHLINPSAAHYRNSDLVLAADCVAYSMSNFHQKYLSGKTLAIACPKLDQGTDIYIEKLRRLVDEAKINTLNLLIMEVPCCGGLQQMVQLALARASRKVPVKKTLVGIGGEVLSEEWLIS